MIRAMKGRLAALEAQRHNLKAWPKVDVYKLTDDELWSLLPDWWQALTDDELEQAARMTRGSPCGVPLDPADRPRYAELERAAMSRAASLRAPV